MSCHRQVAAERSITLFAEGAIALHALGQVEEVATARGYAVAWAKTSDQLADIGIYCLSQERIGEVNANFPVVIPRGPGHLAEAWPHFWRRQPWDRFDLGLLPSPYWLHLWRGQAGAHRCRAPRYGAVVSGWPARRARPAPLPSSPVRLAVALRCHSGRAAQMLAEWTSGLSVEVSIWSLPELLGVDAHADDFSSAPCRRSNALRPAGQMPAADFIVTDDGSVLLEAVGAGATALSLGPGAAEAELRPELGPLSTLALQVDREALRRWVEAARVDGGRLLPGGRSLVAGLRPSPNAAARIIERIEEAIDPADVMPAPRAALRLLPTLRQRLAASESVSQRLLSVVPAAAMPHLGLAFNEADYRARNRDVGEAIDRRVIPDGLTHWQQSGHREGRHGPFHNLSPTQPKVKADNYHDVAAEAQSLRRRALRPEPRGAGSIVVFSPEYDPMSGGTISLHKLCGMLRHRGVNASMWWPERSAETVDRSPWMLPNARVTAEVGASIAVYPEVVDGNPLGAPHVVRWLLNYPGVLGSNRHFQAADVLVHVGPFCASDPDPANELCIIHKNEDVLCCGQRLPPLPFSLPESSAAGRRYRGCFSVRKGAARPRVPLTDGCIPVDGLSRSEATEIFKNSEYFFSYDQYTFLLLEAALAGATSVVIPDMTMSASRWRRSFPLAGVGVAYGMEEVDWARSTRALIPAHLRRLDELAEFQLDALLRRLLQAGWWSGERLGSTAPPQAVAR